MKSGIVLAGGKSSRFGKDKALIQLQSKPLVEWVMEAIAKVVDEVILSLSSGSESYNFMKGFGTKVRIVMDTKPGLGPISGLYSSFREAKGDYVAVAPCDSPFIQPELYTLLFNKAEGHDGAVPFINNFWEPLHAVYRRKQFIVGIENALSAGKTRPVDTYPYLNIIKVNQEEVKNVDAKSLSFININTRDDLLKANKIMENR